MAFDAYIQIDGIPGEALDKNHKDWIEVLGYEYGATQATSTTASSSGGASSQRVAVSDFTIRKVVDKASPKLFEACCAGVHIENVVLNVCRAGGDKQTYFSIELSKVLVSSFKTIAGGIQDGEDEAVGDLPVEQITFNFGSIITTYYQQNRQTGHIIGGTVGGWSREANSKAA
ncbi:type VI secretion system tube protein Hcp [Pseudomonas sp. Marseille-Q5115]|uniref:Hcp family type VI secretion system effector n=1 Tax=Pseudomonas sp. Marseille-Q5115 TaxID=2866593 RepID=UPI00298EF791|nr:type VI secretion system tube protein Hcp [Pseudomonas sp. Marseille-Q5115]